MLSRNAPLRWSDPQLIIQVTDCILIQTQNKFCCYQNTADPGVEQNWLAVSPLHCRRANMVLTSSPALVKYFHLIIFSKIFLGLFPSETLMKGGVGAGWLLFWQIRPLWQRPMPNLRWIFLIEIVGSQAVAAVVKGEMGNEFLPNQSSPLEVVPSPYPLLLANMYSNHYPNAYVPTRPIYPHRSLTLSDGQPLLPPLLASPSDLPNEQSQGLLRQDIV